MRLIYIIIFCSQLFTPLTADFSIVRLKYKGGGDWYNDPSTVPNLAKEINKRTALKVNEKEVTLSFEDEEIFRYPFLFMTGHGNIKFSPQEIERLRKFLLNGGFLYADDDYGMDESFRREIKKVFPHKKLIEVPYNHQIYKIFYNLETLPKIHKHDGEPPEGFGIFDGDRIMIFYTVETNISDGWVDADVHKDPPEKRELAFRMGVNIFLYAITH
jgi:hypothetical protein